MSIHTRVDIVDVRFCSGNVNEIDKLVNQEITKYEREGWEIRDVAKYECSVWLTFERSVDS